MLQLISRTEVFNKSSIADHHISNEQQYTYSGLAGRNYTYIDQQPVSIKIAYDHLQPFHGSAVELDDFAVLAYVAKNREDYIYNCPIAFVKFCKLMGIPRLFMLDELKYNWFHFPFGNNEKLEEFKSIINKPAYSEAFELDIDDLPTILPLFSYSKRWGAPIIYLFPSGSSADLVIFPCNDGNFHIAFGVTERELITGVASLAGLKMGGVEICNMYSVRCIV